MRSSNDLFDLIKALSKSEKRYFKMYATAHRGDSNYIRLFDAIKKQEQYDEHAIRKLFSGTPVENQLHVTKSQLYRLILKSMYVYHSGESVEMELKELIEQIVFLQSKLLYSQCHKLIAKAKKQANTYEKYPQLLEIMKWERKIVNEEYNFKTLDDFTEKQYREELHILAQLKHLAECNRASAKILTLTSRERRNINISALEKLKRDVDKNAEQKNLTFDGKRVFYGVCNQYYNARGDLEKSLCYCKKLVELMEQNPLRIKEDPNHYIAALNNLILNTNAVKEFGEAAIALEKMRKLPERLSAVKSTDYISMYVFEKSYTLELNMHIQNGMFENAVSLVDKIEEGFEKFRGKTTEVYEVIFYYLIAYSFFGARQYSQSLKWLNKVIILPEKEVKREDIHCFARIFYLIIHYELNNRDYLEYAIKSTYRYLYKRKKIFRFETILLQYIRRLPVTDTNEKLISLFRELRLELLPLLDDSHEKIAFDYFDFISWLESKIEKKTFQESVKGKL